MVVYNPFTEEEFKFEATKVVLLTKLIFENGQDKIGILKPLQERQKYVLD